MYLLCESYTLYTVKLDKSLLRKIRCQIVEKLHRHLAVLKQILICLRRKAWMFPSVIFSGVFFGVSGRQYLNLVCVCVWGEGKNHHFSYAVSKKTSTCWNNSVSNHVQPVIILNAYHIAIMLDHD